MNTQPTTDVALLGLDLLLGPDSLISELSPEDEASISGGRRRRSRISRPSRRSRPTRRRRRSRPSRPSRPSRSFSRNRRRR
ncbi:hypothetical protein [Cyanobium sp. LEGE 06113]|uniref:hypothetical protein n=1 Tax=Cyanobium sp. LEGE 06113 TaxID=1297573 RepID=UPI0018810829|nr:hypothetical protein [Cyanobium sp. LEGE 06113]MBE9153921.1 hypothetical protein [Cyanobium sp. LEGE 06113]